MQLIEEAARDGAKGINGETAEAISRRSAFALYGVPNRIPRALRCWCREERISKRTTRGVLHRNANTTDGFYHPHAGEDRSATASVSHRSTCRSPTGIAAFNPTDR